MEEFDYFEWRDGGRVGCVNEFLAQRDEEGEGLFDYFGEKFFFFGCFDLDTVISVWCTQRSKEFLLVRLENLQINQETTIDRRKVVVLQKRDDLVDQVRPFGREVGRDERLDACGELHPDRSGRCSDEERDDVLFDCESVGRRDGLLFGFGVGEVDAVGANDAVLEPDDAGLTSSAARNEVSVVSDLKGSKSVITDQRSCW